VQGGDGILWAFERKHPPPAYREAAFQGAYHLFLRQEYVLFVRLNLFIKLEESVFGQDVSHFRLTCPALSEFDRFNAERLHFRRRTGMIDRLIFVFVSVFHLCPPVSRVHYFRADVEKRFVTYPGSIISAGLVPGQMSQDVKSEPNRSIRTFIKSFYAEAEDVRE
jgi:hypothetical protein